METTHFALKGALEYTVVGARGARLYRFKQGEPLEVAVPEDARKFRGQPDLFFECDAEGNALDPAAVAGQAPAAPRSFKSFRTEPEREAQPPAPPSPPAEETVLSEEAEKPSGDAGVEPGDETPEAEGAGESEPAARGARSRKPKGGS